MRSSSERRRYSLQDGCFACIKHDGSLNDGLELVIYPMSLDWQLHRMPYCPGI